MKKEDSQVAPGTLEVVRTFLNTWWIPNDTRQAVDELETLVDMQHFYTIWFKHTDSNMEVAIVPEKVRQLRTDLRNVLGKNDIVIINEWLSRQPIIVMLANNADGNPVLHYKAAEEQGCQLCAAILTLVVEAIANSNWLRLKACPDCQWVFYDHTKNRNKVWCLMTASGPQGRSCGSIAKVRNFRQRQKARLKETSERTEIF